MRFFPMSVLAALACAALCAPAGAATTKTLVAVTTIPPLADWIRQVGGDRVQVVALLPPGSSAHTFEPSPRDMRAVAKGGVFFKVGLGLDSWADSVMSAANAKAPVVALGDALKSRGELPDLSKAAPPVETLLAAAGAAKKDAHEGHDHSQAHDHAHDHEAQGVDPHFWLDPLLAARSAADIAAALAKADPDNAAAYKAGAAAYAERLTALDAQLSATLAACPHREFASFHDAFGYLANRYGLRRVAVIEQYPGKTPSDRYVKGVVRILRERKITTVFAEPQLDRRAADIIAGEIGGRVEMLDPQGGAPGAGRDTYEDLMRHNAHALARGMGCAAP